MNRKHNLSKNIEQKLPMATTFVFERFISHINSVYGNCYNLTEISVI